MKKNEAAQMVSSTFTEAFSEEQFVLFIRNLLPGMEAPSSRIVPNAQIPQGFREHVHSYTRLGTYRDPQGNVLDVVIVKLKRQGSLDRARTRQRNLMAHYLNKRGKDAVLVAYITDDPADWRFSYVKLAYQTEITDKGKVKVKSEFTPARRYSFLVGENEPTHTAQKQLGDLLMQDGRLTLAQIEEAFNIESVTKEFFEDYKALFLQLKENLDQIIAANKQVKAEFERCEIDTANFAKKLLGQIVFLYFLQKKGWLGVAQDTAWGTGDKKFLHNLFKNKGERNYFDDILEPFFYEALAIERVGDFYPALQCKVPFLNGGLFEPLNGYDWENTQINLDNRVFEEIFKVFNLYNFTVREDEPLEKEVAVDPEMLGKVFENLLEISDRKSKGAYYTPREIVHYMCQESLINYLDTALNAETQKVAEEDIESLIREGDIALENDLAKEAGRKSGDYGLPESIREFANKIDFALADVKICDPAIGSGAFPVGMMTEIVRARLVLTPYLPSQRNRDAYNFKWHCIENSLYGVDIDASAVEIAKLRLWLSLVVDEERYDHIRPLPNLDYRIVCGNSLLSIQKDLFNIARYPDLENKKDQYFSSTSKRNKDILRKEINEIISDLTKGNSLFDYEVYFSEVITKRNGFDVVAGNPPYLGVKGNKNIFDTIRKGNLDKYYLGQMDLFYFFFHLSLNILKNNGIATFITTNYYLTATSAKFLRQDIVERASILRLINFNELKIFESALGQHSMITVLKKTRNKGHFSENVITKRKGFIAQDVLQKILSGSDDQSKYYKVSQNNLFDGEEQYIRLGGISSLSDDPVLSVLNKIKQQGTELSNLCKVNVGLYTGADKISKSHIQKYSLKMEKGVGIFVITYQELQRLDLNAFELKKISPFFKNSDISRYHTSHEPNLFLINISYPENKYIDFKKIPNLIKHISRHEVILRNRKSNDNGLRAVIAAGYWWTFTIRQIDFSKPKIVAPQRSPTNTFGYNEIPWFASADVYFITELDYYISLKYVLALLNSKLYYLWLYHRGKRKGETLELYKRPLSEIPIKKITRKEQLPFIKLADEIIDIKNHDTKGDTIRLEREIDHLVNQLYSLTEEEIAIVEESVGGRV